MRNVSWGEANGIADKVDKTLQPGDSRYSRYVQMIDNEGSVMFYKNAFLLKHGDWILCFTEDHGYFVYHMQDLEIFREFTLVDTLEEYEEEDAG